MVDTTKGATGATGAKGPTGATGATGPFTSTPDKQKEALEGAGRSPTLKPGSTESGPAAGSQPGDTRVQTQVQGDSTRSTSPPQQDQNERDARQAELDKQREQMENRRQGKGPDARHRDPSERRRSGAVEIANNAGENVRIRAFKAETCQLPGPEWTMELATDDLTDIGPEEGLIYVVDRV